MPRVVVVTPTYNERENVEKLLPRLLAHGADYHVVVVDDGSPDGTGEYVETYAQRDPRVSVLKRETKNGLGKAYVAGFHAALQQPVDYIVQMDADFSHDPDFVPTMVHIAEQSGADLVLGSRYISGAKIVNWPIKRNLLSRFGNMYARLVLGLRVSDYTTGFTVFRASSLRQLPYEDFGASGFAFQLEFKYAFQSRGMSIAEVPITFVERREGVSKMHGGIIVEALSMVWGVRRRGKALGIPQNAVLRPAIVEPESAPAAE
ncbi:MAG TPA: polyprenol monophosphomannose synthase [Dehalococcoidia bacterium]|jgi:dolichol-phosphate mannosyltransferase